MKTDAIVTAKTLPNTIVSNGRDVTTSDAQGNYSLPFWGSHVFCVATPGYSPFDGAVVALTDIDKNYDIFPAACKHPEGEFVFAQLADCHISQPGVIGTDGRSFHASFFENALRQIQTENNPDFAMLTGDQCDIGTVNEVQVMYEVLDKVDLPAIQVNGNHEGQCMITDRSTIPAVDLAGLAPDEQLDDFYTYFGPSKFAFFWGRYLFITLDCMGVCDMDQHKWLRALLAKIPQETPIVAGIHHPDMPFWFFSELFDRNLRMIISGHYHTHQTFWQGEVLHSSPSPALMAGHDSFPPAGRIYRMPASDSEKITYETVNLNCKPAFRKLMISRDDKLGKTAGSGPLEHCWHKKLDGAVKSAAPAMANGRIVIAPHDLDADPIGRLQVFEASNGELLWQRRLGDGFFGSPAIAQTGVPQVDEVKAHWQTKLNDEDSKDFDMQIFVQSMTGQIYCISLNSGNILWEQHLGQRAGRACAERVVVTDELALAGDGKYFAAFHRYTGQQQWIWPEDPLARLGSFGSGGTAAGDGVVMIGCAYNEQGVLAADLETGKLRWTQGDRKHTRFGNAVFADGCFYFFAPRDLTCLEAATGKVKWRTASAKWSRPEPLVTEDKVFAATSDGTLLAVERQSGRLIWKLKSDPALLPLACDSPDLEGQLAGSVAWGQYILHGSSDGNLYAVDAETGKVAWKHQFEVPMTISPIVDGDCLFLVTPDATLWKYKLPS